MDENSDKTYTFDVCEVKGDILCARLKEAVMGVNVCNPFEIYQFLEDQQQNQYNGRKVVGKLKEGEWMIFHFNFGLMLNGAMSIQDRCICPVPFSAGSEVIGDKSCAKQNNVHEYKSVFHKPLIIVCSFF